MITKLNLSLSIIYITYLLIIISSSIKKTTSFFTGDKRTYSYFIEVISNNSVNLLLFSLIVLLLITLKKLYVTNQLPKINVILLSFIFLKIWLLLVWMYYGKFDIDLFLSILILLIITYSILSLNENKIKSFTTISIIIAIFIILFNLINYYEIFFNYKNVFWKGRLYGTTNHPNFLGGYLAISLPFLIFLFIQSKTYIKVFVSFFILTTILLILMTGSRTSMVCTFIGLISWIYFYKGSKKIFIYIFFGSIFLLIISNLDIFNLFPQFDSSRLISTRNTRTEVIEELITVFYNNYIIGNPTLVTQTSSSYLAILARGGIIGLIFMLILLAFIILHLSKSTKKNLLTATFASSVISFLFYSIFEGVIVENFSMGQIIFIFSILYLGEKNKNEIQ